MNTRIWTAGAILFTVLCLFFGGCAGTVEGDKTIRPPAGVSASGPDGAIPGGKERARGLSVAASFRRPGGQALARGSVRISIGANSRSYPLDENGELRLAGLPREGALLLTLFGQGEQELGNMAVAFSTGAVIDASTDRAGAGYVVVREDTDEVALEFTLCGGGRLRCALLLT